MLSISDASLISWLTELQIYVDSCVICMIICGDTFILRLSSILIIIISIS